MDEVKDIIVSKKSLKKIEEMDYPEEEIKEEKYIYVDPPKLPQVPKDISDIQFVNINLKRQTWNWKITMPKCGKLNQFKGLYLRAPEGEGPAQLCF